MKGDGHLTASTALGKSPASFVGRNDAAINLCLELVRNRGPLAIALTGSGIFEPLTTAASKRLSDADHIAVYDSAVSVTTTLRGLLQPNVTRKRREIAKLSAVDREILVDLGIDVSLLWKKDGSFQPTESIRRRISILRSDLFDLPVFWAGISRQWDLIVCVNVLPNIAIQHGEGAVGFILDGLWGATCDQGIALIGTIDSHLYQSCHHPTHRQFFAREMQRAVQKSRWEVLALVERAFVRESHGQGTLRDGYVYLILGKNSPDLSKIIWRANSVVPRGLPRNMYIAQSIPAESLWQQIEKRHVLGAFKVGSQYRTISLRERFPKSLATVLALTGQSHLSFGICENLLSCCATECS
jgi:hypothetical protein